MNATNKLRLSILAILSMAGAAHAADPPPPGSDTPPDQSQNQGGSAAATTSETTLDTIVVTGSTSERTILNASVDVTPITSTQLEQLSPRTTADVLQLVPGVFVESTAGPVSNNYSVRGLPGGGQNFVMLQEDGLPILYGGGGSDEYFQNDLTIDRVEVLQGGTSGILAPNSAGASINFFSRAINHDDQEAIGRLTAASYNEERADLYLSGPISKSMPGLAYMVGGYFDSTKGERSSPFTYSTYHIKAALEQKFDNDGYVRVTYKRWDEHDPYYADMPYQYGNGNISGVPGLNTQYGNILSPGFANIGVPDSCATGNCVRNFSMSEGIHGTGNQFRLDTEMPVAPGVKLFAHGRFLQSNWDFNGIFPGSGTGNQGLESAADYLNPATSPIASSLTLGSFPGATQFGLRNLTNGQVVAASNAAALAVLNGNGLLQQTVLNQQYLSTRDFGSNFGGTWNYDGNGWSNSLTVGGMYYHVRQYNDQSAVATLVNGVSNSAPIYDVVALNGAGNQVGSVTNNGMLNYGDWGAGIWSNSLSSWSEYFNDELALFDKKLHVDFGARREDVNNVLETGNTAAVNAPVPAGTPGLSQNVGSTFDGTYTRTEATYLPTSWTVGANYEILPFLSVYARYANGNETNGGNNLSVPTRLSLAEGGVRAGGYGVVGSLTYFHTTFNNQNYAYIQPTDLAVQGNFQANLRVNGVDLDVSYRPTFDIVNAFSIRFNATYQQPKLDDVFIGELVNGITINAAAASQYNGNYVQRTPQIMYAVQPTYDFPDRWGAVYLRYQYTGKIYVDAGNALALPGYGVLSVGTNVNFTDKLNLNVNVWNVTNTLGLTEGNPNSGITETVTPTGYFYARGIAGPNATVSLTYKF